MAFRVVTQSRSVIFAGELDVEALNTTLAVCRACGARRLVLRACTQLQPECAPALAALDLQLIVESPYLAHWLQQARAVLHRSAADAAAEEDDQEGGSR